MKFKPIIHSYWLTSNFEFDKQIEIIVDDFKFEEVPNDTIRIIIIQEPFNKQNIINIVNNNKNCYSYVFTYHQEILDNNEKAILFLNVQSWVQNFYNFEKKFGVSTLVGGKTNPSADGYILRHLLWYKQNEIIIPKDFYLSSHYKYNKADYNNNLILGDDKSVMFNNQFHIVIENMSINNMYTEKILDCFQTKTIPIYYGCPNIDKYFNIDGIIKVENIEDIITVCNNLTPEIYNSKLEAIEENYQKSMNYSSHTEILDKKLKEILK